MSDVPRPSFSHRFCRHFGVPIENFEREVLRRTLYPHASWLGWLAPDEARAADRRFISSVGRLTRRRDFPAEAHEYQSEPGNRGFWRRHGRLRISVRRMQAVFETAWEGSAAPAAPAARAVTTRH